MPFVRQNEPISAWLDGDYAQGYALLRRKEVRQDRNGRDYLDLELSDASGSITGKVWPDNAAVRGDFNVHEFVAFKGTIRQFREQLQINVEHCRRATDRDRENGFDEEKLIPTAPGGLAALWQRLEAIYPAQIGRPSLRKLAEHVLAEHGDRFRVHAAGRTIHHAYRGGLLEHTVTLAELALQVCAQYPAIDRDLVLLGALFHDLGKLDELSPMPATDYTLVGHLVGHVVLGRDLLRDACRAVGEVPTSLQLHLEHLVLSHQGRYAYGSPKEPSTPEAYLLHLLDDLDSKLYQLLAARAGGQDMAYVRGLDRYVYAAAPASDDDVSS